jgi:hypothetical protein
LNDPARLAGPGRASRVATSVHIGELWLQAFDGQPFTPPGD